MICVFSKIIQIILYFFSFIKIRTNYITDLIYIFCSPPWEDYLRHIKKTFNIIYGNKILNWISRFLSLTLLNCRPTVILLCLIEILRSFDQLEICLFIFGTLHTVHMETADNAERKKKKTNFQQSLTTSN